MDTRRTLEAILVIVIALCGLVVMSTVAQAESGTDMIHEDYYVAHPIQFLYGDSIDISYTMRVTDGPNIDVYFLDKQNYVYYQDGVSFTYYVVMSEENTQYESSQITLTEHDTYYLIFDNTNTGTDPPWNFLDDVAYVEWTIDHEISSSGGIQGSLDPSIWLLLLAIIAIIVILTIALVAATRIRKGEETVHLTPVPYQQQTQTKPAQQTKHCGGCGRTMPLDSSLCPYCGHREVEL